MRRLALGWAAVALLALPVAAGAAPSLLGPTGLMLTPTAYTVGMTQFNLGGSAIHAEDDADETILYANVGLLPGLELGIGREEPEGAEAETVVNAKLQVLRPPLVDITVAAGVIDATDQIERTGYLVLSHTIGAGVVTEVGPVTLPQVHIGVGTGRFDGVFGGVSTVVARKLELMAEYDTEHVNVGARFPIVHGLQGMVAGLDGAQDFAASLSFSSPW